MNNMFQIIGADGKQYGPVTADQVRQWVREGRANGQTQLQADGGTEWRALSAFPEFADLVASSTAPGAGAPPLVAPPAAGVGSRASNKIAAGICGILLGGLGVHKFILGYSGAGGIMLAATIGGWLLTIVSCGITFFVPMAVSIVGLVEGIIYLTKSDEEFVRIYVDGRKEWF
jgi:TM2 domain-containing membrane protein YozV